METETVHAAATADEVATEPTTGQFFCCCLPSSHGRKQRLDVACTSRRLYSALFEVPTPFQSGLLCPEEPNLSVLQVPFCQQGNVTHFSLYEIMLLFVQSNKEKVCFIWPLICYHSGPKTWIHFCLRILLFRCWQNRNSRNNSNNGC